MAGTSTSLAMASIPSTCSVVVFDARSDGQIDAASQLEAPVVAVVGDDVARAARAVQAGVRGLLIRSEVTPRRLVAAVRAAHEGSWTCPSDLVEQLLSNADEGPRFGAVLTDREHRVLELLSVGLSTDEIAERMSYSPRTIKNQVQSILVKLDCRNRAQAVGVAVRQGWI